MLAGSQYTAVGTMRLGGKSGLMCFITCPLVLILFNILGSAAWTIIDCIFRISISSRSIIRASETKRVQVCPSKTMGGSKGLEVSPSESNTT